MKINTPLNFYIEKQKSDSVTPLHRNDIMKNWRELSDLEKAPYIRAVAEDYESLKEKRISKDEQKILDTHNGIPARPLHPFNEFIKDFQKTYNGEGKERFREASVIWKNMNSEDKQKYFDKSEANTEIFRMGLEQYVSGLPAREREETWNKLRLSKKMKMTNLNDSLIKKENGDSKPAVKVVKAVSKPIAEVVSKVLASPIKVKKIEEIDVSTAKRHKKKLYNESEEEAEIARKKFKIEKEVTTDSDSRGSPKKKKKKENKMSEPSEYPSQTKQHYFLTHIYKGAVDKPEKINAAWMKLSKNEKTKINDKVAENQKNYMKVVQAFIAENDRNDVDLFKARVKECASEQSKAIAWCKNIVSDSSSDSDMDSDSS